MSKNKNKPRHLTKNDRQTPEYKKWRAAVLEKCGNKCVKCGSRLKLQAHHIKCWAKYPELRYDISNGCILCVECHKQIYNREHQFESYFDQLGNVEIKITVQQMLKEMRENKKKRKG